MREHERSRRQFLTVTGTGLALGLAGCSSLRDPTATETAADSGTSTATSTLTETATATDTLTESKTATETELDPQTETETKAPGYKKNHWHGRLFFEVNGELVDFHQPKYFLKNLEKEYPETVYFHFHDNPEAHGPNEWSNEKKIITFQRALNLLPGIDYTQKQGKHVVSYKGTTYDATTSGTSVSVHRGTNPIDPTSYEVQHDDNFWVQATSEDSNRNATTAHSGADVGTLLFDINNHRVDFSRKKYLQGGSDAFNFHDDSNPNMWYKEGAVTLQKALNALPGISYEQRDGNHVFTYKDKNSPDHSREFNGGAAPHEVLVRERTTDIDPTTYEPTAGDIIWIYIHSSQVPDNEH